MNALSFLIRRQIRNFFRDMVRHPSKLVLYLVAVGFFVLMIVTGQSEKAEKTSFSDLRMLEGIFLGWLLLFSVPMLFSSLKSGTTMFAMSDVNLLFVSPLPPKRILFYGLVKQAAATLLGFVFLLFNAGTLMQNFGIGMWDVILLLAGSALLVIVVQVVSLLLYSWSNGNAARQSRVRTVLTVLFAALAAAGCTAYLKAGGGVEGLFYAFDSPLVTAFPFIGWMNGLVFALIRGQLSAALLWGVLLAAGFALCIWLFLRSDADYYEDVLQTTEIQYEAKRAVKEKRQPAMRTNDLNRKTKLGETGLGRGWGAAAFFYKHLREVKRRSRFLFLNRVSVTVLIVDLVIAFIGMNGKTGEDGMSPAMKLMLLLAIDVYVLFLTNAAGDWTRELSKPYLYLVPEEPFRKLLWASMSTALKPVLEGVLFFTVLTAALQAEPLAGLTAFLGYASFGLLFLAGNILSQRVFGSLTNRGVVMFLYLFMLLVLMSPGVAGSIVLFFAMPQTIAEGARLLLAGLVAVAWNILVSLGIIYACRNLLATAEAN